VEQSLSLVAMQLPAIPTAVSCMCFQAPVSVAETAVPSTSMQAQVALQALVAQLRSLEVLAAAQVVPAVRSPCLLGRLLQVTVPVVQSRLRLAPV
jgi:hypothetical protein